MDTLADFARTDTEHFDVLIVGAGLSGIGAAYHLQRSCPTQPTPSSRRATRIGGTWDLFRYPGVRSDSDMYTLGYSLPPVDGAQGDRRRPVDPATTCATPRRENGIDRQIRFGHRVVRASWSTPTRAGPSRSSAAPERDACASPAAFSSCAAATTTTTAGYTPEFRGHASASRAASCIRSNGPTTSTTRASASSSSAAARPR